ncbi:MAG TPA: tryptophan-rich sensory protein [Candidatus Woesearchaeota archaeon]|nr:tryptophan-rich sensory protein [Candidatus Woesearchaeota archaeon]
MKPTTTKILVAVAFFAMVLVNTLATTLPINGITLGEVSDSYPNLFAPAGVAFSIWGLIYLLLGIYVLYQFGVFEKVKEELNKKIGIYFIITSIANILWIFAWHYQAIWLSLLIIIALLYYLIRISQALTEEKLSEKAKWLMKLPFSVYFGWIIVATIANVTVFLVSIGWTGFFISEQAWTSLVIITGTIIGLAQMLKAKDIAYGLVFVWAYGGIWIKHASFDGFANQYLGIITTILICIALFIALSGFLLYKSYREA